MLTLMNSSNIYISQAYGDDGYSGTSPAVSDGGFGPLRTFNQAFYRINSLRSSGFKQPLSIKVIGDYCLENTVRFGIDKSDNDFLPEHEIGNITLESYGDEKARLIGGKILKGFKKDNFNGRDCISLYIPEVKEKKWHFTDLYVNGKRANSTRYPKNGTLEAITTENPGKKENFDQELFDGSKWFVAKKEDLENIKGIEHSIVSFYHYWIDEHSPVESYDRETGKLTLEYTSRFKLTVNYDENLSSDLHYYLENVGETFSDENEWFLDVEEGMLYYIPEEGADIDKLEIIAPTLERLIEVKGYPEHRLCGVRIRNIDLIASRGDYVSKVNTAMKEEGKFASDAQSVHGGHGAILFEQAECSGIYGCNISCMGVHAIEINYGSENIHVENCNIENIGAGGVKIYGNDVNEPIENKTSNCVIKKNLIKNCGKRYAAGCGVLINHSSNNEVSDNEICYLDYTGISVGWRWGYHPSNTYGNIIKNNHIHHLGMGRLSDMGGVYLLGCQKGTVVEGNHIHDVISTHYGGWGLYTDEGSSYITLENNVVYRCKNNCYHQHFGSYNTVRNNVFAFSGEALVRVSRNESHVGILLENNTYITDGNYVYDCWVTCPPTCLLANNNKVWDLNGEVKMFKNGYDLNKWQTVANKDEGTVIEKPKYILIDKEKREIKVLK
ncbi:MAG: right-handed parallel beta-helix repeat-containing protein [Clostridia bacterium]|nr:right-handed parallel beta-helix repeat-containing protein [Clostridia bacterium]